MNHLKPFALALFLFATLLPSRAAADFGEAHRFVFYAVLEGCYEDGLSNQDVSQILLHEKGKGLYSHFVYGCPLCTPTIHALEAYRNRPDHFYGLKTTNNTFGLGLTGEVKTELYSSKPEDRLAAINTLVQRWVSKRMTSLRLTDVEQTKLKNELSQMRDKGSNYLKGSLKQQDANHPANSMSAFQNVQQCAVCNGACGLNLKGH
jgi:hypothetical protein